MGLRLFNRSAPTTPASRRTGQRRSRRNTSVDRSAFEFSSTPALGADPTRSGKQALLDYSGRDESGLPLPVLPRNAPPTEKFEEVLQKQGISLGPLVELSWFGVPHTLRGEVWSVLLEIAPVSPSRREHVVNDKRQRYLSLRASYFGSPYGGPTEAVTASAKDAACFRQVSHDAPRFFSECPYFQRPQAQGILLRVPFVWAIRHPASGYVQGSADVLLPILAALLGAHGIDVSHAPPGGVSAAVRGAEPDATAEYAANLVGHGTSTAPSPGHPSAADMFQSTLSSANGGFRDLTDEELDQVESDSYNIYSALMDHLQVFYLPAHEKVQDFVRNLEQKTERIDADLYRHLSGTLGSFFVFAFRWLNCLLIRELPVACTCRLLDTYCTEVASAGIAARDGETEEHVASATSRLATFHMYVCISLLERHRKLLLDCQDMDSLLSNLQCLPTRSWSPEDADELLAYAYVLYNQYEGLTHDL